MKPRITNVAERIRTLRDSLPKTVNGKIRRLAIRDNDAGNREE